MTEVTSKANFRKWHDDQTKMNAKLKEGRKSALASAREEVFEGTMKQIEKELRDKGVQPMRTQFGGFRKPWKRG